MEGQLAMVEKLTPTLGKVYGKERDRYLELVNLFPLRPIRTDAELDAAIRVVDMLVDLDHRTKAEEDYLDFLSDLVEAYEDVHIPIWPVSDADMLQSCLEDWRVTQAKVAKDTRIAESTISEVLAGKRKLNRAQIGKLAGYFKVSPSAFAFGQ
jgi:HTH-type transcriptional regulator/antitoxin HigA